MVRLCHISLWSKYWLGRIMVEFEVFPLFLSIPFICAVDGSACRFVLLKSSSMHSKNRCGRTFVAAETKIEASLLKAGSWKLQTEWLVFLLGAKSWRWRGDRPHRRSAPSPPLSSSSLKLSVSEQWILQRRFYDSAKSLPCFSFLLPSRVGCYYCCWLLERDILGLICEAVQSTRNILLMENSCE